MKIFRQKSDRLSRMGRGVCLLGCLSLLCGCAAAKQKATPAQSPADFVAVTLGQAAEKAHGDLAMLAKLRGEGVQPLLPPPDPSLNVPVTVAWTGPADGILKAVCLKVGYRYQEMGRPSAQPLMVVVQGTDRPAYSVIEDVAWQVQPQATVRVDVVNRILTLGRTGR